MTLPIAAALHPVREALLARARADARAQLEEADKDAERVVDDARVQVGQMRADARRSGAADAQREQAVELAGARRRARAQVLAAQREAYETLRRQVREALLAAVPPERLTAALAARARAVLGSGARIIVQDDGGVIGEEAGRRVDCSVDALVERALGTCPGRVERLWSP
jgi:vacuolar-type H+-ATPase subunit E/Vma4